MDLKDLRQRLAPEGARPLSQNQLATLLGYKDGRAIRDLESGKKNMSGPAELAVNYVSQAVRGWDIDAVIPEFVLDDGGDDGARETLIHLRFPRFIAMVVDYNEARELKKRGLTAYDVDGAIEFLVPVMWIDNPVFHDPDKLLKRAAAFVDVRFQEAIDRDYPNR